MIAPLSWLKDYVEITLTPNNLGDRLTEVGLGTEKVEKIENDALFHLEITPNRPDLLSIIGIAREIAAIEGKTVNFPKPKIDVSKIKPKKTLPLSLKTDPKINPRFSGIIIDGVTVKESPGWLKERLRKINQRPINNIVDITNYVMFELGNPIHAFDYHKIKGQTMIVTQTSGGEKFKSVDGIEYRLPKDAVIIKDDEKIIDLCGIKGGFNSGTFEDTKTIFIRVPVEIPVLIRKASQSLGLRSDASSIFERMVNAGGTIETLNRCVELILEIAGGEIASELYDLKKENFSPWKIKIKHEKLTKILGIDISPSKVEGILNSLDLKTVKKIGKEIEYLVTIPTHRNDLKIEEDIIEEVGRLYGYNNFPKTIPEGEIPIKNLPYFKDYKLDEKAKNIMVASGFFEIYTYSLISEKDLTEIGLNSEKVLRIDNPVSLDYEYLRPTLKIGLVKALFQNKPNFEKINLFELGKVYLGKNLDEKDEVYYLSAISNSKSFFQIKGVLEVLFRKFGIDDDPTKYIEILDDGIFFEVNFSQILETANFTKIYNPIPKYPSIIEDLAFIVPENLKTEDIVKEIKMQSNLITDVSLLDQFKDSKTFHIVYQSKDKNLTNDEVREIRKKIISSLEKNLNAKLKN
ncbi:MAG: phenylalanine--tRNA ligase subunit beta [Candidatus Levybacteria bacterium RBG_16_35_6]|nr:MAG: phenylalanine--tRNA ligase subunit beta [Candidatus Levybacteria bacterium RBG_16_35_6]